MGLKNKCESWGGGLANVQKCPFLSWKTFFMLHYGQAGKKVWVSGCKLKASPLWVMATILNSCCFGYNTFNRGLHTTLSGWKLLSCNFSSWAYSSWRGLLWKETWWHGERWRCLGEISLESLKAIRQPYMGIGEWGYGSSHPGKAFCHSNLTLWNIRKCFAN